MGTIQLNERHLDIIDVLAKYKNDPDVYIQYSNILKLGINPKYQWSTPLGIYGYPLMNVWQDVLRNDLPFGSNCKLIHIFRINPEFNYVRTSSYTASMFQIDKKKIKNMLSYLASKDPHFDKDIASMDLMEFKSSKKPVANLLRLTDEMASRYWTRKESVMWNVILRQLGYDGIIDDLGSGQITGDILWQAVFLTSKPVQLLETIPNVKKLKVDPNISSDMRDALIIMHGDKVLSINDVSEEEQIKMIKQDYNVFKLIHNPTINVQRAAVDTRYVNPNNLPFVSKQVQMEYLKKNGLAIGIIKNPSLILQKIAVVQNPNAYYEINNKSEDIQIFLVSMYPNEFRHLRNPSEKVKAAYDAAMGDF